MLERLLATNDEEPCATTATITDLEHVDQAPHKLYPKCKMNSLDRAHRRRSTAMLLKILDAQT